MNYKDIIRTTTRGTNYWTLGYCSLEQCLDMYSVDYRTDFYAIGMITDDVVTNYGSNPVQDSNLKYFIDKYRKE